MSFAKLSISRMALLLSLAAAILAIPVPAADGGKDESKIRFEDFTRTSHCTSAGMNLYVRIGNTSSYNVILKSCTAVIRCGCEELMQIELRERAVIPKRSTSEVLLPLRFRADNSMSIAVLLRRILQGRIDDMTVTMTAKCRASIISKTFSMQNVAMSEILDNFGVTIDNVKRLSELL